MRDKPGSYAPTLYCWRGGQRSHAMATVLSQVGWRTRLAVGGYKTYRSGVTAALYGDAGPRLRLVLLDGDTGSAKTEIIGRLNRLGWQTLDLEGLANHRGSVFGGVARAPQPSQKLFESRLLAALAQLDLSRPIIVEAESSRIGDVSLPATLWKAMVTARRINLQVPRSERARYLASLYLADAGEETYQALETAIDNLPRHLSRQQKSDWKAMVRCGAFETLADTLIETHYDPAYSRSKSVDRGNSLGVVTLDALDALSQQRAAGQVAEILTAIADRLD